MDAAEFLKEWKRMCERMSSCSGCAAAKYCTFSNRYSPSLLKDEDDFLTVVSNWSREHPRKTRLQDFKEKYPNNKIEKNKEYEHVCCEVVGYCEKCKYEYDAAACKDCWNEPV